MIPIDEAFKKLNIPVAKFKVARTMSEVMKSIKKFPVVLKSASPKIVHKTEAGAVVIVRSKIECEYMAKKLLRAGRVIVQEYVRGVEFFLGIKEDPVFGHVLLAGLGGIFVEVYKDVSFRVCPISVKDAREMLEELKGKVLLEGFRGLKPVNRAALLDAMVKFSRLSREIKNVSELDVNPLIVNEKGVKAVDVRMVLKE